MTRRLDDLLVCARALHYAKMLTGPLTQAAGPFSPPKPHMQIFCSHEQHMPRSRSHPKYPTPPERAPERLQPHMRAPRYTIRVAAAVLRQQHKSQNENRGLDFYKKICYNIKKDLRREQQTKPRPGPPQFFANFPLAYRIRGLQKPHWDYKVVFVSSSQPYNFARPGEPQIDFSKNFYYNIYRK